MTEIDVLACSIIKDGLLWSAAAEELLGDTELVSHQSTDMRRKD